MDLGKVLFYGLRRQQAIGTFTCVDFLRRDLILSFLLSTNSLLYNPKSLIVGVDRKWEGPETNCSPSK